MLDLIWTPYSDEFPEFAVAKLKHILNSWAGTPYGEGQQCRGKTGSVDCVRFVCAVLDELDGGTRRKVVTLPHDTAMHSPESARASMRRIMRLFMPHRPVTDKRVEPGDVLVTGPRHGGPGHAMIVGFQKNTIWEATSPYVRRVGWSLKGNLHNKLYRVLRMTDRSKRWAKELANS